MFRVGGGNQAHSHGLAREYGSNRRCPKSAERPSYRERTVQLPPPLGRRREVERNNQVPRSGNGDHATNQFLADMGHPLRSAPDGRANGLEVNPRDAVRRAAG